LLLPLLARLSERPRWLAWVAPPHLPFAPGLSARGIDLQKVLVIRDVSEEQRLWAAEQALKSASCSAVLLWPQRLQTVQVRRLQLAAEQGDCLGVLFRSLRDAAISSPAALRMKVSPSPLGLDVQVLKRRAGWGGQGCSVRLS
jgi:cell division inhibitor SulA